MNKIERGELRIKNMTFFIGEIFCLLIQMKSVLSFYFFFYLLLKISFFSLQLK